VKVLIFGGTGFLGSHIAERFYKTGHEVLALSSKDVNLLNADEADAIIGSQRWDWAIHSAGVVAGIGGNVGSGGRMWFENSLMGMNVLEAIAKSPNVKLLLVGTACSYPKDVPMPYKEEDMWNGFPEETNGPYGLAKRNLLAGFDAMRQEYGMKGIAVCPANLYGDGVDNYDLKTSHVIPAMIRKMHDAKIAKRKSITLWGTGTPTRDLLMVSDCADAIRLLCTTYENVPGFVNIGSGVETSVKKMADVVRQVVNFKGTIAWDKTKPDGQPRRVLSTEKLAALLPKWEPVPVRTGVRRTYEYYKANLGR